MSTVPEVITAKHCGLTVFGLSLVTNVGIMDYDSKDEANHQEVLDVGEKRKTQLKQYISAIVSQIQEKENNKIKI